MTEPSSTLDQPPNPYSVSAGKIILFVSTVIVTVMVFSVVAKLLTFPSALRFGIAGLSAAVAVLIHVFAGARAVRVAEQLMAWGFPAEYDEPWETESRLLCGAIWVIVLAFWAVVATFNRTVTRLYKQ